MYFNRPLVIGVIFGFLSACTTSPTNSRRWADSPTAVDIALNATVAIVGEVSGGFSGPECTAFFVSPRTLVTAFHCVDMKNTQLVQIAPGIKIPLEVPGAPVFGSEVYFVDYQTHLNLVENLDSSDGIQARRGTVIQADEENDLALIRLVEDEPNSRYYLPIRNSLPSIGERVYGVGMPNNNFWIFTEGMVSSIRTFPAGQHTIVHQAHVAPGASGGPLIDNVGFVVGVNIAYSRGTHYIGFATRGEAISNLLKMPVVQLGTMTVVGLSEQSDNSTRTTKQQSTESNYKPTGGFCFKPPF